MWNDAGEPNDSIISNEKLNIDTASIPREFVLFEPW
jgi:hypothetical protein